MVPTFFIRFFLKPSSTFSRPSQSSLFFCCFQSPCFHRGCFILTGVTSNHCFSTFFQWFFIWKPFMEIHSSIGEALNLYLPAVTLWVSMTMSWTAKTTQKQKKQSVVFQVDFCESSDFFQRNISQFFFTILSSQSTVLLHLLFSKHWFLGGCFFLLWVTSWHCFSKIFEWFSYKNLFYEHPFLHWCNSEFAPTCSSPVNVNDHIRNSRDCTETEEAKCWNLRFSFEQVPKIFIRTSSKFFSAYFRLHLLSLFPHYFVLVHVFVNVCLKLFSLFFIYNFLYEDPFLHWWSFEFAVACGSPASANHHVLANKAYTRIKNDICWRLRLSCAMVPTFFFQSSLFTCCSQSELFFCFVLICHE